MECIMTRDSLPFRARLLVTLVLAGWLAACAPAGEAGSSGASDARETAFEPRIALAPTGAEDLPSALLGQAGPLSGAALQYVPGDASTTGYLAVPDGPGPFPALVIVHEWDGLKDRVRQVADNLAAEGYVVLAADLFGGRTGSNADENRALTGEVMGDPATMIANLDAAVAYLRGRSDVTGRVGAMGWCFGGGVALSFGLDGVNHEATAIFYGRLIDDPEALAKISHEVYGTFAELDGGIPPEAVERFAAALDDAGVENDLHVYDDVNHGFWLRVDQDPELRAGPALDAWQRLKAYLERALGS
jgi:carboxymethylenebutenolidase